MLNKPTLDESFIVADLLNTVKDDKVSSNFELELMIRSDSRSNEDERAIIGDAAVGISTGTDADYESSHFFGTDAINQNNRLIALIHYFVSKRSHPEA